MFQSFREFIKSVCDGRKIGRCCGCTLLFGGAEKPPFLATQLQPHCDRGPPTKPILLECLSLCSSHAEDSVSVFELMHLNASCEPINSFFECERFARNCTLRNLYLRHFPPSVNPFQSAIESFEKLSSLSGSSIVALSASNYPSYAPPVAHCPSKHYSPASQPANKPAYYRHREAESKAYKERTE